VQTAPLMRLWIKASWPVTSSVRKTTKALARLFHVAPDEKFRVTERDIDALLLEGVRAGSLDPTEQAVMRRALRLSDVRVEEAMVPRDQVLWLEPAWSDRRVLALFRESGRSNFVVSKGGLDRVLGVVRAQDWLLDHNLEAVMTEPIYAEPEESLLTAIERLRPSESRLLVVRKGERVVGVLTLNDILCQVVGPIAQT
jgi:putative hemolysin